MAILEAEPNIFPSNLLSELADEPTDRQWWVLRTKARQEKAIARDLSRKAVPFYLPLHAERRTVRGKTVDSHLPMFEGYVFVFGSDDERVVSLKTNRVAQVLPVIDQKRFQRDLSQVEKLAASGAALAIESKLLPGRRVKVTSGSLMGLEGVILTRRGVNRLFVSVDLIQQGVSLEVDDFMIELL
jgi:transcription antitermination factor NusG